MTSTSTDGNEDYESNIQGILKDLVFHILKNKPKNIVRNINNNSFIKQPKYMVKYLSRKVNSEMTEEGKIELEN